MSMCTVLKRVSIFPLTGHFFSNLLHLLKRNGYQQHLIGLPTWLSFCLSVVLSLCPSVCLFYFFVPFMSLFICLPTWLSVYLSVHFSTCLSVCLSDCLSVFLSSSNVLFYFFSVGYRLWWFQINLELFFVSNFWQKTSNFFFPPFSMHTYFRVRA
jgi:hypothetical protein